MGRRFGDETVIIEGRIEQQTAKAVLVALTAVGPDQVWLPKSQIVSMSDPDPDNVREFVITDWIAKKNGLV